MHSAIYVPSSPPLMSPKILTIKDLCVVTTSNAAPSSIFAVTNSTATLPNYHAPDTEQLMIAHPSIAHPSIAYPLILLPMMVCQKMVQPGAAFGGTTCDGNTHHGAAYHATMYDGTAYDSANASGTAFDCASKDSIADAAALP